MRQGMKTAIELDRQMAQWTIAVHTAQGLDMNRARTACASIIVRARKLSTETRLSFDEVSKFLLEKTQRWAINGTPMHLIMEQLPDNLRELGIMKMVEDFEDVRKVFGRPN